LSDLFNFKFKTIFDLAEFICAIDKVNVKYNFNDDYDFINVVAHYDIMKELIEEVVKLGVKIDFIHINDPMWDNYDDAFILELYNGRLTVEKVKRENGYIFVDEFTLVHSDVSKNFYETNKNRGCTIKYFTIEEIDEKNTICIDCDMDCENCNETHYELAEKMDNLKISDDYNTISYENKTDNSYCKKSFYTNIGLTDNDIKDFIDDLFEW